MQLPNLYKYNGNDIAVKVLHAQLILFQLQSFPYDPK